MFPNPQDALPLLPRPKLEQYRKLAKDLVKACRSGEADAITEWTERWLDTLRRPRGRRLTMTGAVDDFARRTLGTTCTLSSAQFVIARSHGFESWAKLSRTIEALSRRSSPIAKFEAAADAIVKGDAATLGRLLRQNPRLARSRSTRGHRATLLHYVSANGVENVRQKSPRNAVKIAEILLDAGAEVDAEADVYGGGATTLGLVATSIHPQRAGVQNALLQTLLNHGAAIGHPRSAGNEHDAIKGCLANGQPGAAAFLAERSGARLTLETAAGVGRLELVRSLAPKATRKELNAGFMWACLYGRDDVVAFLLANGVDVGVQHDDGQTGLHCAAIGGHLSTIGLLLEHNAPLEVRNMYGGTVLGQAVWSAAHGGEPELYAKMIETLIAAGARVAERHPPVNRRIDAVLRRHGSRSDSSRAWFGEAPKRKRTRRG